MIHPLRTAALITALSWGLGAAPPAVSEAKDRSQILAVAREVMKKAHYCTLVTMGESGQPQARMMDPSEPAQDFTIWLATTAVSRKVVQIRKEPRVTLSYFDRSTMSYVTFLGNATLVADAAEKEKHWQAGWAPFYPEGPKTPALILIRFVPQSLEISSVHHKLMNDPQTWRAVSVGFK